MPPTNSPRDWIVGYCTNVHAGTDVAAIRDNLARYSVAVRGSLGRTELPVGLWLPDSAARELQHGTAAADFAAFLTDAGLTPYTLNGFPLENFHREVVKHDVYRPAWWEPARTEYTLRLARLLAGWLPDDRPLGTISTLPIGWPTDGSSADHDVAAAHLRIVADALSEIESATGRRIVLAIEPEPGCVIDRSDTIVEWFDRRLDRDVDRRHLGVCHDVCHAAVMDQPQSVFLDDVTSAGITIGKVQISSGIVVPWEWMATHRRREAAEQLAAFAEDRYLHQTGRRTGDGGFALGEDLPDLLSAADASDPSGGDRRWTVHFHVPIFLERFGHLTTTRDEIEQTVTWLKDYATAENFTGHLEVETYAWGVLPEPMRRGGLAGDIAREMEWLSDRIG